MGIAMAEILAFPLKPRLDELGRVSLPVQSVGAKDNPERRNEIIASGPFPETKEDKPFSKRPVSHFRLMMEAFFLRFI